MAALDSTSNLEAYKAQWSAEQFELKKRLVTVDAKPWSLDPAATAHPPLRLVGGVDISFVNDPNNVEACASLVVLSYPALEVVYEDYARVELQLPYIPGFLAFREVGFLVELVERLRATKPALVPEVIMVDGNGILHTRGFGLACHLGVLVDIPTVGVAKTFFAVDGLHEPDVKREADAALHRAGDFFPLRGRSGAVWGAAVRALDSAKNPVFVSVGHRVGLETSVELVLRTSRFRVPEPIRQADLRSRAVIKAEF